MDLTPASEERKQLAAWLLRQHLLDELDAILIAARLRAVLVKGAALAHRYDKPWQRSMADIDVLTLPEDAAPIQRALRRAGFSQQDHEADRRHSQHAFFEESFYIERGGATLLVELHTQLDKMVARPIELSDVFARARPRRPTSALLLPCDEDHLLLLVLHAASSDFAHPAAWSDLALLWQQGPPCLNTVVERARRWRLSTALYLALRQLRRHDVPIDDALLRRVAPGSVRRRLLPLAYDEVHPLNPAERTLGWRWVGRQTTLRDDSLRWFAGVASYAARRALDHLLASSP